MKVQKFAEISDLFRKLELDKVVLLAFYHLQVEGKEEFSIADIEGWIAKLKLPKLNAARLKKKIRSSRQIIKGSIPNHYALHISKVIHLSTAFPSLNENEEVYVPNDEVIPIGLYKPTRGYIEALGNQINASYTNNLFDGCAVLMRRMLEILLIHSYEKLGIDSTIRHSSGDFKMLGDIIDDAKTNPTLSLSRNTKANLEDFRNLGNFSAHKIFYTAKRSDIRKVSLEFRAAIEELLYKGGIKS